MSPNIFGLSAYSPIDIDDAAKRLPGDLELLPVDQDEPRYREVFADPNHVFRSVSLDNKCRRLEGVLERYGLPANVRFVAVPRMHEAPDVQRAAWFVLMGPMLGELFAAGPSYGEISDGHCDPPIIWSPQILYLSEDAHEIPLYAGLIDRWPGIEEARVIKRARGVDHGPWLSGRFPLPYPFFGNHEVELAQLDRLMGLLGSWSGEPPASSLLDEMERELGPIEFASVLVPALVRLFPAVPERVRWANAAFLDWHAGDRESFDRVMSKFVT